MLIFKLYVIQKYGQYSLQSWGLGHTSETGPIFLQRAEQKWQVSSNFKNASFHVAA